METIQSTKTKLPIRINLLCLNEDCNNDYYKYDSIEELHNTHSDGEILCPGCKCNSFSIVMWEDSFDWEYLNNCEEPEKWDVIEHLTIRQLIDCSQPLYDELFQHAWDWEVDIRDNLSKTIKEVFEEIKVNMDNFHK